MNDTMITVAFADLAGFTALTEAHGDLDAVSVIERFDAMARELASSHIRVVKVVGDEVMLAGDDPADAALAVLALATVVHATPRFPLVRAGVHHGPVVARAGDYFGTTVNVASRLTSIANPGQVIASSDVATAVRERTTAIVTDLGLRELRNLSEPLHVFELLASGNVAPGQIVDPVCRMRLDPVHRNVSIEVAGQTVRFCSEECARRYAHHPGWYVVSE